MIFWHAGASIAIARGTLRDPRMDLRFLLLGALVADLVDTPIGLIWFGRFHTVRLVGHTLLAAAAVMVAVLLLTRRGRLRRRWMAVTIGMLLHLVLDAMWRDPETLWWPFLGTAFSSTGFATAGAYVRSVLTDPVMWAGEVAGVAYLLWLASRARLGDPDRRRQVLSTGLVDVPIGRSG